MTADACKDAAERKESESESGRQQHGGGDMQVDWGQLGVSRVLVAGIRTHLEWRHPTPVQRETIPLALAGHDILVNAVTGSGKSGAFIIPTIQRLMFSDGNELNERRVLCIGPTRELVIQIHGVVRQFVDFLKGHRKRFSVSL